MPETPKVCIDVTPPATRVVEAAELSVEERPTNAPLAAPRSTTPERERLELAVQTDMKWDVGRRLRVRFLDGESEVWDRIEELAHQWEQHANLTFVFGDDADAEIRISFLQEGSWSYLGDHALTIPEDQPTMNYGWLTPQSTADEYSRVVLHEFGHALGAYHEHSHPEAGIPWDREAVYAYYAARGWSRDRVDTQLFAAYKRDRSQYSQFDPRSIMLYPIPNELTIGDFEVGWNRQLSQTDKEFMQTVYPFEAKETVDLEVGAQPVAAAIGAHGEEDHYRFTAETGTFVIETSGPTDVVLALYGPDSDTRPVADDDDSGRDYNARIETPLIAGAYFLRVRHFQPTGSGSYTLSVARA